MKRELIFRSCETKVGSLGIQLPITIRPPGFVTRTISLATSSGLAANIAPNTERVKSKVSSSIPCRLQASPSLNLRRSEALSRRPTISGVNKVPGNIDSNYLSSEPSQRNSRSAVSTAEVQDPQRRPDPERFHDGLTRFAHEGSNRSEIAFFP